MIEAGGQYRRRSRGSGRSGQIRDLRYFGREPRRAKTASTCAFRYSALVIPSHFFFSIEMRMSVAIWWAISASDLPIAFTVTLSVMGNLRLNIVGAQLIRVAKHSAAQKPPIHAFKCIVPSYPAPLALDPARPSWPVPVSWPRFSGAGLERHPSRRTCSRDHPGTEPRSSRSKGCPAAGAE